MWAWWSVRSAPCVCLLLLRATPSAALAQPRACCCCEPDPVGGETVLRSKDGAWGISDDKTNGESHLRANGKPAGAVPDESLN
eukprot:COSAG06_NODE_64075_length_260_cov_0.968944_1_plen_82_part_01